jgi:hypothetical protein
MHVPVYMPPALVRGAGEAGFEGIAVDPWDDPRAVQTLLDTRPDDLVLCDRGLGVTQELLARVPGRTVLYYPDPLPTAEGQRGLMQAKYAEFRRIAAGFDHVVLHDSHGWEFLQARGHDNLRGVVLLPYNPRMHRDLGLERDLDIVFVGLASEHRERWMAHLRAEGVEVHWPQVWGEAFVETLNRAKIVLNLHSLDAPNTEIRLVEAMACGAMVVSERITDCSRFTDGEHLVYITPDTAPDTLRWYLAHTAERQRIARAGQAYVAERHTARHVVEAIVELVSKAEGAR